MTINLPGPAVVFAVGQPVFAELVVTVVVLVEGSTGSGLADYFLIC